MNTRFAGVDEALSEEGRNRARLGYLSAFIAAIETGQAVSREQATRMAADALEDAKATLREEAQ